MIELLIVLIIGLASLVAIFYFLKTEKIVYLVAFVAISLVPILSMTYVPQWTAKTATADKITATTIYSAAHVNAPNDQFLAKPSIFYFTNQKITDTKTLKQVNEAVANATTTSAPSRSEAWMDFIMMNDKKEQKRYQLLLAEPHAVLYDVDKKHYYDFANTAQEQQLYDIFFPQTPNLFFVALFVLILLNAGVSAWLRHRLDIPKRTLLKTPLWSIVILVVGAIIFLAYISAATMFNAAIFLCLITLHIAVYIWYEHRYHKLSMHYFYAIIMYCGFYLFAVIVMAKNIL